MALSRQRRRRRWNWWSRRKDKWVKLLRQFSCNRFQSSEQMALLYVLLWRTLLVLVHLNRALVFKLRVWVRKWKGRLLEWAMAALLLPLALAGFPDHQKKFNRNANANANPETGNRTAIRRSRWLSDGRSLEKLPVHIGLLVAEEEPSYTDIANLVVWCMAVGISYVSIYDNHGKPSKVASPSSTRQQQQQRSCCCFCFSHVSSPTHLKSSLFKSLWRKITWIKMISQIKH